MSEVISVRLTPGEKRLAETLGTYLHKKGHVPKGTVSDAVRVSIRYLSDEITKSVERERLAREG